MTTGLSYTNDVTESILSIQEVGVSDGGVYQCVVTQPTTGLSANANELVLAISKLSNTYIIIVIVTPPCRCSPIVYY